MKREQLNQAAPELLAALKGCVLMLMAIVNATGIGFECLGPAHDAIAKAEGE